MTSRSDSLRGREAAWEPQPRQAEFLSRGEYEALYGGAAGGGKSDALLAEAMRQVGLSNYRAIIFRKTYPELSELIDRSHQLYTASCAYARYNDNEHCWRFPGGARIYFGAMHRTEDRTKYQGKRYNFIGFDELTHFQADEYSYLFSRNRSSGGGCRNYIRSATNPGGPGHGWVKQRFVDPAPPGETIWYSTDVRRPDGTVERLRRSRVFIPASVFDNQRLLSDNPEYLASLAMLPPQERDALLYGRWDVFSGQVFTEFVNSTEHYDDRRWTHVIAPFRIPQEWPVFRSFDWGYAKPFSVGWFAVDYDRRIYRISEYYGCQKDQPNTGIKMQTAEIAENIRRIEAENPLLRGRKISGVADPAIFDESRGESIAATMAKAPNHIYFAKGDHTRIPGKMQFHYRFAFDDNGYPMFQVFNTCENFIRTLPNLVYSQRHVEDIDSDQEDHIYDDCRYALMTYPVAPRAGDSIPVRKYPANGDPLNLWADKMQENQYKFYRM